jgi:hypothetical protein
MAHFRGTIQGNRTEASRLGTKASGLQANVASWEGAVVVEAWHNKEDGHDWVEVKLVTHINGAGANPDITLYEGPIGGSHRACAVVQ